MYNNALLLRAFVILMKEFIEEVFQVGWAYLAHDHQVRYIFAHFLESSPCIGRLGREKCHQLASRGRQDHETSHQEKDQEDLTNVRYDLRSVSNESHRDKREVDHLKVGRVRPLEDWVTLVSLNERTESRWKYDDEQ